MLIISFNTSGNILLLKVTDNSCFGEGESIATLKQTPWVDALVYKVACISAVRCDNCSILYTCGSHLGVGSATDVAIPVDKSPSADKL